MTFAGTLRSMVRTNLLRWGVDTRLTRTILREQAAAYHKRWSPLIRSSPRAVIDIGANVGQFATLIRGISPEIELICMEPLAACQADLQATLTRLGGRATRHHCALGSEPGLVSMNRNEYLDSSSLLPLAELHRQEWPFASHTTEEKVTVVRLDDLIVGETLPQPYIVKIDVQGFEMSVISGGPRTLAGARAAVVECSSYQLYEGQSTFDEIHTAMKALGFVFRGVLDQAMSSRDSRIMQFDALFEHV